MVLFRIAAILAHIIWYRCQKTIDRSQIGIEVYEPGEGAVLGAADLVGVVSGISSKYGKTIFYLSITQISKYFHHLQAI